MVTPNKILKNRGDKQIKYGDNVNPVARKLIYNFLKIQVIRKEIKNSNIRILELGCSTGALGNHFLNDISLIHWHGVDYSEEAIKIAKTRLSNTTVLNLNAKNALRELESSSRNDVNLIVMCDIFEHLDEPCDMLESLPTIFKNAEIIITLPNIASEQIFLNLANRDFPYADSGILDKTHKSFYTIKSFKRLAKINGYKIASPPQWLIDPISAESMKNYNLPARQYPIKLHKENFTIIIKDKNELVEHCSYGFGLHLARENT